MTIAASKSKSQPWKDEDLNKAEWVAREVAKAVNAGKAWDLETVDFSDPNRPATCLEVDFPIIPINQIAAIEGNAGKPIYQMSKWWARRRSSVFRAMLLAAAIKAPDDPSEAAKLVWDVYYGNHQKKGVFKHLKVADIFMGGGTTVVEGSRLGMQMYGNDLNLQPEHSGACAAALGSPPATCLLTVWLIQTFEKDQKTSTHVVPIAVDREGQRVPKLEKRYADSFQRSKQTPVLSPEQRRDLIDRFVEPTLQRELRHRGLLGDAYGHSVEMLAFLELS